ncbi:hypothetical protein ATE80_15165 [Streptomyces kanasensis]|uniref:Uncharacterized protein n=1 Tax=Streptomyces kanasensis TaxID=936756 RepID=A0A100Y5B8_9ACTN|nr:hypothetical protein ATE80_15165 [Streptomyces kanasensis]
MTGGRSGGGVPAGGGVSMADLLDEWHTEGGSVPPYALGRTASEGWGCVVPRAARLVARGYDDLVAAPVAFVPVVTHDPPGTGGAVANMSHM